MQRAAGLLGRRAADRHVRARQSGERHRHAGHRGSLAMVVVPGVFIAVLAIVLGTYWVVILRPERADQRKLRKRIKSSARAEAAKVALVKEAERLSSVGFVEALLRRATGAVRPIQRLIDQSGCRITVG